MVDRRSEEDNSGKETSKKAEREQRILDAAAELLQKWGARKTTLGDIAKRARVAKGTLYLSWKTREELFMALVEREEIRTFGEIVRRMEADPEGMTLPGLIKHSILVTLQEPLLRALVLQDTEFLGELVTREYNAAAYRAQMQGYMALLEVLRNLGLIRGGVDLQEQAISLIAISWGFLLINPLMPGEFKYSDEAMVEMIVAALKRQLEPETPPTAQARSEGEQVFRAYIQSVTVGQQQQNEVETQS